MIPARFARKYDERRLRNLLLGLFVALAIPTGAVIWQAYDQLKWESWYQYRNQAESLVRQIDFTIAEDIAEAESREFDDFTFLASAGPSNVQRRSPLSATSRSIPAADSQRHCSRVPVQTRKRPGFPRRKSRIAQDWRNHCDRSSQTINW